MANRPQLRRFGECPFAELPEFLGDRLDTASRILPQRSEGQSPGPGAVRPAMHGEQCCVVPERVAGRAQCNLHPSPEYRQDFRRGGIVHASKADHSTRLKHVAGAAKRGQGTPAA